MLEEFVYAYAVCALWSSTDVNMNPLDDTFGVSDIAPATYTQFEKDCAEFIAKADLTGWTAEQAGHDFWLTRNGHGTGFWDRDFGTERQREDLTTLAKSFSQQDLYVGDDKKICH